MKVTYLSQHIVFPRLGQRINLADLEDGEGGLLQYSSGKIHDWGWRREGQDLFPIGNTSYAPILRWFDIDRTLSRHNYYSVKIQ